MLDLYSDVAPWSEPLADGAVILRRYARDCAPSLYELIQTIAEQHPFYHRITPGGFRMSVTMTNRGELGWTSDSRGYRYASRNEQTDARWPPMPALFREQAVSLANEAGFSRFKPDACLIDSYQPGAKMSLHQDKDEQDLRQPIVSVSLGLPAIFLFGGFEREQLTQKILLEHGDVVVWGGPSRLWFHGVQPLKTGNHPLTGAFRFNLTFRQAHR
ncbi:MAG: Alpha-ketoglutarate-dependent dioxygenase AlkB [Candidatus Erwinia impunctatus]